MDNNASCNLQDALGRTPLHDFATGQGTDGFMTVEHVNTAIDMINILVRMGARFDIKDEQGHTALDLALEHAPDLLVEEFIKHSLKENPELAKPSILDKKLEMSIFWDAYKKEVSTSLKTNLPESISGNSAAFFQTPSSNSATYDEQNVQFRPRK